MQCAAQQLLHHRLPPGSCGAGRCMQWRHEGLRSPARGKRRMWEQGSGRGQGGRPVTYSMRNTTVRLVVGRRGRGGEGSLSCRTQLISPGVFQLSYCRLQYNDPWRVHAGALMHPCRACCLPSLQLPGLTNLPHPTHMQGINVHVVCVDALRGAKLAMQGCRLTLRALQQPSRAASVRDRGSQLTAQYCYFEASCRGSCVYAAGGACCSLNSSVLISFGGVVQVDGILVHGDAAAELVSHGVSYRSTG